jgi:hypothetical protein
MSQMALWCRYAVSAMARRRKPKPFRAVTAVKSAAREQIGAPPPTRRQENPKKKSQPRHKPTLADLLKDEP